MAFELPADCDVRIRRFAEYLASKAPAGRLPGRQHIIPTEIADLLPFLALYDVVQNGSGSPRFRVRLAGTHVVELFGHDPTGKCMDEYVPSPKAEQVCRRYHQVVQAKEPSFYAEELCAEGREHVRFQRVAFPLARDGENVDMLVLIRVGSDRRGDLFKEAGAALR